MPFIFPFALSFRKWLIMLQDTIYKALKFFGSRGNKNFASDMDNTPWILSTHLEEEKSKAQRRCVMCPNSWSKEPPGLEFEPIALWQQYLTSYSLTPHACQEADWQTQGSQVPGTPPDTASPGQFVSPHRHIPLCHPWQRPGFDLVNWLQSLRF